MFDKIQVFKGENPNVWKYVFEKEDICVEAVLYKYDSFEKRTVMCVSVQSGCPVGCVFCGTGKKFIRNLTEKEIMYQVDYMVNEIQKGLGIDSLNARCEKFQIMFMSMGEPMLNWDNVDAALIDLNRTYPNAQLLISTIGVDSDDTFGRMCITSKHISKVGLQFSLHSAFEDDRNRIIPFKNKMDLRKLRDAGLTWNRMTGRPVYLNICITNNNMTKEEKAKILDLFSPTAFSLTFSVICEYENGRPANRTAKSEYIMQEAIKTFLTEGYNVRKFDPAGQDDIGAGCGQLWYVQEWMKQRK